MTTFHRNTVMVILYSGIYLSPCFSQIEDYSRIFGENYDVAVNFIKSNSWISDSLNKFGIDPCVGIAVVFPETIRYSEIRDKIETRALLSLYVQYGSEYSDFSIGHFQMKPSFAEKLEKEYLKQKRRINNVLSDTTDSVDSRKERINRLCSTKGQVKYLSMFFILMDERLSGFTFPRYSDRLIILSAAYNYGFMSDIDLLKKVSRINYFYTGLLPPKVKYNYSEISVDYFRRNCLQDE
jgi:hypothetical protein